MADKAKNPVENVQENQSASETTLPVDLTQYVPVEDFRKFQSSKDREVERVRREKDELAKRVADMEAQMEALIQDPVKRAEFQVRRTQTQLEYYQKRDELEQQKKWFQDRYGVPAEALEGTTDSSAMTLAALDWQKQQREAASVSPEQAKKVEELKKLDEEGAHNVSTLPDVTPDTRKQSVEDIDKAIENLRIVAQGGGSAGARARVEILKLERAKQQGKVQAARARV